jgi:hypothetical protein
MYTSAWSSCQNAQHLLSIFGGGLSSDPLLNPTFAHFHNFHFIIISQTPLKKKQNSNTTAEENKIQLSNTGLTGAMQVYVCIGAKGLKTILHQWVLSYLAMAGNSLSVFFLVTHPSILPS